MSLRRLLLLPLLSPLLAVLIVAALNPGPRLSLQLLTWSTPRAPLALWLGGMALGGAALSGAGTALALRQGEGTGGGRRRRVATPPFRSRSQSRFPEEGGWEGGAQEAWAPRREREEEPAPTTAWRTAGVAVAPPRSPGEPSPTVDVPFRVLRRPGPAAGPAREREPVPVGLEDDWGADRASEDW